MIPCVTEYVKDPWESMWKPWVRGICFSRDSEWVTPAPPTPSDDAPKSLTLGGLSGLSTVKMALALHGCLVCLCMYLCVHARLCEFACMCQCVRARVVPGWVYMHLVPVCACGVWSCVSFCLNTWGRVYLCLCVCMFMWCARLYIYACMWHVACVMCVFVCTGSRAGF